MDQFTRQQTMEAVQWKGIGTFDNPGTSHADFLNWGVNLVPTVDYFNTEVIQALDTEKSSRGTTFEIGKNDWIVKRANGTFFKVKPARFASDFTLVT